VRVCMCACVHVRVRMLAKLAVLYCSIDGVLDQQGGGHAEEVGMQVRRPVHVCCVHVSFMHV